jgi:hypothetical protein
MVSSPSLGSPRGLAAAHKRRLQPYSTRGARSRAGGRRLLHSPQVRLAVDDEGRVEVLVGSEMPRVRNGDYRRPHLRNR